MRFFLLFTIILSNSAFASVRPPEEFHPLVFSGQLAVIVIPILAIVFYAVKKLTSSKAQWLSLLYLFIGMLVIINIFAFIYYLNQFQEDYLEALYFSMVTWSTLGYGDLQPNNLNRFFAAFEALLGYLYLGILVSVFYKCLVNESNTLSINQ